MSTARLAIALDQNFPTPIMECVAPYLPNLSFSHIHKVDPRLSELDDWKLIVAIHKRGFHVLASNDHRMIFAERVVLAAAKTATSLVLIESLGDDPVRATGTLLLDIEFIARTLDTTKASIFRIRRNNPQPTTPAAVMEERAKKLGIDVKTLRDKERLSQKDMTDPLA